MSKQRKLTGKQSKSWRGQKQRQEAITSVAKYEEATLIADIQSESPQAG